MFTNGEGMYFQIPYCKSQEFHLHIVCEYVFKNEAIPWYSGRYTEM